MNQIRKRVLSLVKTGAVTQAVAAAAEFTRRNPRMADAYELLAQAEEVAGYTRAAIKTISHAIALVPQEPAFRFQRGRLNLKINALTDAIEDMTAVIEIEKQTGDAYYTEAATASRDETMERMQSHRLTASAASRSLVRANLA